MKKNLGLVDRVIRIILAIVLAVLFFTKQITGAAAILFGILAIGWILTSAISYSPVYALFKISTKKKE